MWKNSSRDSNHTIVYLLQNDKGHKTYALEHFLLISVVFVLEFIEINDRTRYLVEQVIFNNIVIYCNKAIKQDKSQN